MLEFYRVPDESDGENEASVHAESSRSSSADSRKGLEPDFSLLVQPRSLLVLKEDVYNKYMHGIREVTSDDLSKGHILNFAEALPEGIQDSNTSLERGTRISLTFRIVQKTLSSKKFFRR